MTDETDPDLMWALRGGGGDFGVVTAVEIDLHAAPEIYGGKLMFPIEDARPVLRAFAATSRQAPDELTLWASLMHFPPAPFLPEPIRGRSFVTVDAMYLGGAEPAEALLAPIRAAGTVLQDTTSSLSPSQFGGVAQEPTDPTPGMDASALMPGFDDAVIDRILEVAGDARRTPVMSVQVRHLGGALARDVGGNAVAHRVEHEYLLFALGMAPVEQAVAASPPGWPRCLTAWRSTPWTRRCSPSSPHTRGPSGPTAATGCSGCSRSSAPSTRRPASAATTRCSAGSPPTTAARDA